MLSTDELKALVEAHRTDPKPFSYQNMLDLAAAVAEAQERATRETIATEIREKLDALKSRLD